MSHESAGQQREVLDSFLLRWFDIHFDWYLVSCDCQVMAGVKHVVNIALSHLQPSHNQHHQLQPSELRDTLQADVGRDHSVLININTEQVTDLVTAALCRPPTTQQSNSISKVKTLVLREEITEICTFLAPDS